MNYSVPNIFHLCFGKIPDVKAYARAVLLFRRPNEKREANHERADSSSERAHRANRLLQSRRPGQGAAEDAFRKNLPEVHCRSCAVKARQGENYYTWRIPWCVRRMVTETLSKIGTKFEFMSLKVNISLAYCFQKLIAIAFVSIQTTTIYSMTNIPILTQSWSFHPGWRTTWI